MRITSFLPLLVLLPCITGFADEGRSEDRLPAVPQVLSDRLVPEYGALLGHYYGAGSMADTDKRIGARPLIHLTYFSWEEDWSRADTTRRDFASRRVPLVNWEPFGISFADIINGKYDGLIRQRAESARALQKPFFLDFAAEMNEEEGWGGHDPGLYVKAFQHIHDIFIRHGAKNVVWVWCPNNTDSPQQPEAMRYYPGDSYVDWVCIDGYNWGNSEPEHEWQSFHSVFRQMYKSVSATGKPVLIGETASDEAGGNKAEWINNIIPTLKMRFPAVKAVVWFDIDKERHWPVNSSPEALAAYRRYASDPYMISTGQ